MKLSLGVSILFVTLAIAGEPPERRQAAPDSGPRPRREDSGSLADSELRWARSADGLHFTGVGEVFLYGAAAPDLIQRPRGDVLALFDYAGVSGHPDEPLLAVSRSRDRGATWSRPRRLRSRGGEADFRGARHGALVSDPDGLLRLYYATPSHSQSSASSCVLRSAISRNGLDYRPDPATRLRTTRGAVAPAALRSEDGVCLFLNDPGDRQTGARKAKSVQRVCSEDGRRFSAPRPVTLPDVGGFGSVLTTEDGYRAYVSSDGAIRSLVSRDGRIWTLEDGVRMANAADAAVARLEDGTYLMLYSARQALPHSNSPEAGEDDARIGADRVGLESSAADSAQLFDPVDAELEPESFDERESIPDEFTIGEDPDLAMLADSGELPDFDDLADDPTLPGFHNEWDLDSTADLAEQAAEDLPDDWSVAADDRAFEDRGVEADDGFAPRPDFDQPVDYFEWYRAHALDQPEDNAYEAYAEFMPAVGEEADWPPLSNMFEDGSYTGPPAPWNPAAHPEWEASHLVAQGLLAQFREATRHQGYAHPAEVAPQALAEIEGPPLLLSMVLPHLSSHRQLAKATLADAWRAENGQVSSVRMLDAWETTLRGAGHIERGATLIENLVGVSERRLVHENARWALAQNVFDGDELESALDLLTEHDQDTTDPARGLRGEQAFAMDITQHLFAPDDPAVRQERLAKLAKADALGDGALGAEIVERIARMTQEDARAALDAFNGYYRDLADQMRVGYPKVRSADLDATADKYLKVSPLTEVFLPALSRVHKLRARSEASRRATQLSYAVHLYKARNGRWPAALDELPAEAARMRTDPFTGGDFGYQATEAGPRIYSHSENARDDGGIHAPKWDDEKADPAASDDFVFWPPQKK